MPIKAKSNSTTRCPVRCFSVKRKLDMAILKYCDENEIIFSHFAQQLVKDKMIELGYYKKI